METLFTILWKSAAILTLFYVFYRFLLCKETHFESNRYFLLVGIIASVVIPFIVIPIYTNPEILQPTELILNTVSENAQFASEPILNLEIFSLAAYLIATLVLLLRFALQLVSIALLIRKSEIIKTGKYYFVEVKKETSPFSFFNYIVYNPYQFNNNELQQILTHEKVHAIQKHSIDTLLANLLTLVQWFNPFAWLYKRDIEQNLEFIADSYAKSTSNSKQSYQQLLLKTIIPKYEMALANNFYNSLLKKRIIMLHKQRSKAVSKWKFVLILPFLVSFLFTFNTKAIAQQKEDKTTIVHEEIEIFAMGISKESDKGDLDKIVETYADKGLTVKFSGIKRNNNDEITAIKIDAKSNNKKTSASYATNDSDGIDPIQISFDSENNNLSIGPSQEDHHTYTFTTSKNKNKGKNFIFLSGNDENTWVTKKGNKKIVIEVDEEGDNVHKIVIGKDKDKTMKKTIKIKSSEGEGKSKFMFISSDGDDEPLYLLDGEEITKKQLEELDTDTIETIEVVKGDKAIEKYGEKAKGGVVMITSKK